MHLHESLRTNKAPDPKQSKAFASSFQNPSKNTTEEHSNFQTPSRAKSRDAPECKRKATAWTYELNRQAGTFAHLARDWLPSKQIASQNLLNLRKKDCRRLKRRTGPIVLVKLSELCPTTVVPSIGVHVCLVARLRYSVSYASP